MKKILALVLALTLALGTFSFAAAAPADVVGTDYEDAVVRLGALGIIAGFPDGTYQPDQPVTRAQFAKIIVTALGVGEAANYAAGTTKFSDVPADHWAAGYINVAVDVGVISGYPDGTFKPENQVTFAEAIKMIVAALGYTPKADAMGGYPGGYLAVAAEKEITEGMSVVGGLAANRGDVALMIDNALDVPLMVQKTYGQYPEYEEDDEKSLLVTKLGVDELKNVVVTAIPETDSNLDDDEIEIDGDKYTLLGDHDLAYLLGLEVTVWADDDDVFFMEAKTDEDDILFDEADTGTDDDELFLRIEDDSFDWADDAEVYINFEEKDVDDVTAGLYGKVVLEDDEVIFASFFDFTEVVAAVVGEEDGIFDIVTEGANEDELELDDYEDGLHFYTREFKAASEEDLVVGSAIFAWEDSDELYAIVVNEKAEGVLDRAKDSSVRVDGTSYSKAAGGSVYSDDGLDNFAAFANVTSVENLMDEEVTVILDVNGEALLVYGDAETTSGTMYGIATYGSVGKGGEATVFTNAGEEVDYDFEERSDAGALQAIVDASGESFFAKADNTGDDLSFAAMKFKLNSDGEIADGEATIDTLTYTDGATPTLPGVVVGKVGDLTHTDEKTYVTINDGSAKRFYISEKTVFMAAVNEDGELDPAIVDYEDIYNSAITSAERVYFVGTDGEDLKFCVFLGIGFEGADDDYFYGVVQENPWKDGDDWVAEIDVFDEGKAEYVLATHGDFAEGDLVKFYLNSKNEAVMVEDQATGAGGDIELYDNSGDTAAYADGYLDVVTDSYKVDSNAVVYELDEDGDDIEGTISKSRMDDFENIVYAVDDEVVVAVTVWDGPSGPAATDADATIASDYILDAPADTVTVKLTAATGKTFADYTLAIYSAGAYVKSVALTGASVTAAGDVFEADAGLGLADNTEYTLRVVELATGTVLVEKDVLTMDVTP